jgi:hypothetical protein
MTMIKLYHVARSKVFRTCVAVLCSFAFWAATNYCNLEALAAHPAQSENSSQHHSVDDHHGVVPTPGGEEALCCETLHAVLVSKVDVTPKSLLQRTDPVTIEALGRDILFASPRSAIGWSPPERGPTPPTPFYRTTYANRAPPVCLA